MRIQVITGDCVAIVEDAAHVRVLSPEGLELGTGIWLDGAVAGCDAPLSEAAYQRLDAAICEALEEVYA